MNDPKQFPADYKFDPETGKPILHLAPIEKRDRVYPYVCAALCLLAANFTLFGGFAAGFSIAVYLVGRVCAAFPRRPAALSSFQSDLSAFSLCRVRQFFHLSEFCVLFF